MSGRSECDGKGTPTYVAPDGCPVNDVPVPHNGVDEHVQASNADPKHVEAGTSTPGFEMPWQWDDTAYHS